VRDVHADAVERRAIAPLQRDRRANLRLAVGAHAVAELEGSSGGVRRATISI
jgi:hypothetical protein